MTALNMGSASSKKEPTKTVRKSYLLLTYSSWFIQADNLKPLDLIILNEAHRFASTELAESCEVKMLNTGADSIMVFDQSVLSIIPRDSVTFTSALPTL